MDFLGEYEAICGTVLSRESGPWGECLMKKNRGSTTFLKSYKKKHFYEWGDVFEQAEKAKIRLITS
jgi:hypothetical protein